MSGVRGWLPFFAPWLLVLAGLATCSVCAMHHEGGTGLAVYIVAWVIALPWMVWNQWREMGGER